MSASPQTALHVLMIRPAAFGANPETAASNAFQSDDAGQSGESIQAQAVAEFDAAVDALRSAGVSVVVIDDTKEPKKPDAVFPNNWLSTHAGGPAGGTIITWPMMSATRRLEVRQDVVEELQQRFVVGEHWVLHDCVRDNRFLEGTGSLVLDRSNRIAFACRSPRTEEGLVREFCKKTGFAPLVFAAVDRQGQAIYHTNVMMAILNRQAVVCLESIRADEERRAVTSALEDCGHSLIEVSFAQMEQFAANVLQIARAGREPVLALSTTALAALDERQRRALQRESQLVPLEIPVLERFGGGSVRCMIAEIFLEPRQKQEG